MIAKPLLLGLVAVTAAATSAQAADARHPTVVELFQSQGCSSCPPANANLMAVAGQADILALSFGVTYWDDLGWKDTFAKRQFTARQWDYEHAFHINEVSTPQVIVNGRQQGIGADPREFVRLLRAGDRGDAGPSLVIANGQARIGAGPAPARTGVVWLVRYDPRILQVRVNRGENRGKTLPHRNVVRQLVRIGSWRGQAETIALPHGGDPAWLSAVFIQAGQGGPILAAAKG